MLLNVQDANRIRAGEKLPIKIKKCDVILIVHEALDEVVSIWGDIFNFYGDESLIGYWSPEQLQRAIENLTSLAAKYRAPNTLISIKIYEEKSKINIQIHQTGSAPHREGVELTLIRGIAKAHGGKLKIESFNDYTLYTLSFFTDCRQHEETTMQ